MTMTLDDSGPIVGALPAKGDILQILGGPERLSRYEMGVQLAQALGVNPSLVRPVKQADAEFPEPRPRDVSLNSTRWTKQFPDAKRTSFAEAARQAVAGAA